MTDQETVILIKKLIKQIKKDFGKKPCSTFCPECANCKAYILLGYLVELSYIYEYEYGKG
jgi:hypothetical protein